MAVTGWSSSNYLRRLSQVINTYPFFISGWFNQDTTGAFRCVVGVGVSGSSGTTVRRAWCNVETNNFSARLNNGSAGGSPFSTGTWTHFGGEFVGLSERSILTNGADKQTNTTVVTDPTASDSLYIGCSNQNTFGICGAAEGIAEISIWGTSMTAANMDSLAALLASGDNPINLNAQAAQAWTGQLVAYWPLTNSSTLTDATGHGHTLTMVGTVTNFASHPTIDAVTSAGIFPGSSFTFLRRGDL